MYIMMYTISTLLPRALAGVRPCRDDEVHTMATDAKVRRMRLRDGLSMSAIAFEPATPCAQGR
jgi:hypothetical protein